MATKQAKKKPALNERLVALVPHDLKAKIHRVAENEDRSVGSIIRAALEAYLKA